MDIRIAKGYELKYWNAHKKEPYFRSDKMLKLFNINLFSNSNQIVADVGCGPRGGIFHSYSCNIMYGVDPLWSSYKKSGLAKIPDNVQCIKDYADTFTLPQKADMIISVNALDHSGSLENSILNIMSNIKSNGLFCLHVHMRTKKQLNKGHRMIITEGQIDNMFVPFNIIHKKIYDKCPIEDKPYRTYVSVVQNV